MKKILTIQKTHALQVGAGLVAAGATAAAGYYFYVDKKAASHRKIVARWATDMKKEVMREAKKLQSVSPTAFAALVDRVASTVQEVRAVDKKEVARAEKELKTNWDHVQRETTKTVRKSVARVKAKAKRAA